MLRTLFVLFLTIVGGAASFRGPLEALLFYLWVAYFRPESWIYSEWFVTANISLISGIFVVVRMLVSNDRVRLDVGTALLALVVLHGGVSAWHSEWSDLAFPPYINFVKSLIIAVVMMSLVTSESRLRLMLSVIGISLGIEAAKQGWVYLLTMPGTTNINDIPFLGDNNAVAVGLFTLLPIVLALAETASRRWERYGWIFLAIGIAYRGLSTYSRGGFLAAGTLVFLYIVRSKRHRVRRTALAIAATALLLGTMPNQFWARMDTINTGQTVEGDDDRSAQGRLHFWTTAVKIADAYPFLGVGNGQFNQAYDRFDDSDGEYGHNRSVHSVWFGLLSEGGYVGLGLALCVLLRSLFQCQRLCRSVSPISPSWKYSRALQNSLLVFCVGGSFVPLQYNEMFWHFMGLTFGLSTLLENAPAAQPEVKQVPLPMHPVAAALMRAPITTGPTRG
jgi:probable O-glycosylation ligase (exosortase A-associated)